MTHLYPILLVQIPAALKPSSYYKLGKKWYLFIHTTKKLKKYLKTFGSISITCTQTDILPSTLFLHVNFYHVSTFLHTCTYRNKFSQQFVKSDSSIIWTTGSNRPCKGKEENTLKNQKKWFKFHKLFAWSFIQDVQWNKKIIRAKFRFVKA